MPAPLPLNLTGPRWLLVRALAKGVVLGAALAVGLEAIRVLLGNNLHEVVPGRVYRAAQSNGPGLERLIRRHGIRTVVNLRGSNVIMPWFDAESRATAQTDATQEDICLSAGRLPSTNELRRLIAVFDRAEYPLLLHCRRGADRTGLSAAVALLLLPDATFDQARRQLGPRYGHVALGRPAYLDAFFDQYEAWLNGQGAEHTPTRFRKWADEVYLPAGHHAVLEPLEIPQQVAARRPFAVRIRAHNTGDSTWQLRPESTAGVHLRWVIKDRRGVEIDKDRSGMYETQVGPGERIDLTLALPALPAGAYRLFVDLMDEQHLCFFQGGSEPWEWEFEARDQAAATAGERRPAGLAGLAN
jgi:hypothetical protein